jgi:high-affinity Fe2+/Pb2+ permease
LTEHGFYDVRWRIRDIVLGSVVAIISTSAALLLIGLVVAMTGRQDLGPVEVLAAAASEVLIVYVVWRLAVKRYASGGWAAKTTQIKEETAQQN